jgi:hypothetical protein
LLTQVLRRRSGFGAKSKLERLFESRRGQLPGCSLYGRVNLRAHSVSHAQSCHRPSGPPAVR